jgi:hypothetical protein
MTAKNLVHEAILAGHSARFLTAADLILDLTRQETARALPSSSTTSVQIYAVLHERATPPRPSRLSSSPLRRSSRLSLVPLRWF